MILRLGIFALLLLLAPSTLAQTPLAPNAQSRWLDTAGHLAWFKDESGKLTLDEVRTHAVFRTLPGNLSEGYTPAALWLRFDVVPEADAPASWILEVADALLDDVRLYVPEGDEYVEHRSGDELPRWQWEIDCRNPAFHLRFEQKEPRRFYLRLWTRHAMSVPIHLWQAEAFDTESRNESFNYGVFYGVCGLVLLFHLIAQALTRERINWWFVLYFAMYGLTGAISFGHFQQVSPWHGTELDLVFALVFCMLLGVSTSFALMQMESAAVMPRFTRYFQSVMWGSGIACALWALFGHFGAGMMTAQVTMLAAIALLLAIAIRLALRGHKPARHFLVAFGVFYLAVMLRHLRDLGVLAPDSLTEYGIAAGALIHTIAVSLNITRRSNESKRAKLAEQSSLNERLEAQVALRTSELTAEVAARAALELDLREALAGEIASRQEQRDFVAMVSHEFRTPLAIIDTSAQRIAGTVQANPGAALVRCANIRSATRRMTQLMDEFLSFDRLDGDLRTLELKSCDPRDIVERVAAELEQERLVVQYHDLPSQFSCDIALLRVALNNLLTNALRHSLVDTSVSLSVRGLPDGAIEFAVADEGQGIAEDELPKLFQRYFRGRASMTVSGAGLGLYLVDHIARLHRGSVRAESQLGQGARFILLLPGAPEPVVV